MPMVVEARPNARWSLNFVHDQFANGRRLRILNVVDDVTKECLAAIRDTSISDRRVARELTTVIEKRGKPGLIVSDNGTEFTCNAMLAWCRDHQTDWHFIAPGRTVSWRASTLSISDPSNGKPMPHSSRPEIGCASIAC